MTNKKDFSSGLFLFLLGMFLALLSVRYSIWSKFGPDEGFFPLAVAMIIMGLSLVVIVRSFFAAEPQEAKKTLEAQEGNSAALLRVAIYVILMIGCGLLIEKAGFLVASGLLMLTLLKVVEKQSWKSTLLIGFGSIAASYVLFVHLLGVPLPRGFLAIW